MTDISPEAVERLAVMLDHDDKRQQTTGSRAAAALRAQAAEIERLTDALDEAQSERLEQARLLGMSAEREMGLRGQIERLRTMVARSCRICGGSGIASASGGTGNAKHTVTPCDHGICALPIPDREGA